MTDLPLFDRHHNNPPDAFKLFDDQQRGLDMTRDAFLEGHRRIMLQIPTGGGKTIVSAHMTRRATQRGKPLLFIVPFIELVDQTIERFAANGITDVGVIQGNGHHMENWSRPVQIASVHTLERRWPRLPEWDTCIIDEAHLWYRYYSKLFAAPAFAERPVVGLSATPWARGLGGPGRYTKLVKPTSIRELIELGRLSPYKVYAPDSPDLTGVGVLAGDFKEDDLSAAMRRPDLIGNVASTWCRLADNRSTLVFAVDSAHADALTGEFMAAGVAAERVYGGQDGHERRAIRRRFESGETRVVINVGVLTHGVDWDVRCLVIARPTKSEILHNQIIGRVLRVAEGKDYGLILDHSDNHFRLGSVIDVDARHVTLDDGAKKPKRERGEAAEDDDKPKMRKCPDCMAVIPPRQRTCECGWAPPRAFCTIKTAAGKLIEIPEEELADLRERYIATVKVKRNGKIEYPRLWFAMLRWVQHEKNYKAGWAAHAYRERYGGDFPPFAWNDDIRIEPTKEVAGWLKSRNIRKAKSKVQHVA